MRPLSKNFFGPAGLQCIFASDDDGTAAVGYIVQQTGTSRFIVTDGNVTKTCTLAQTSDDIASLPGTLPVGMMTLLSDFDDSLEHVRYITENRCVTIEGSSFPWHLSDPTDTIAQIGLPFTMFRVNVPDADQSQFFDVSADASVAVGSYLASSVEHAMYWAGIDPVALPELAGGGPSSATCIAEDASTIGGWCFKDGVRHLVIWGDGIDDLGYQDIGDPSTTLGLIDDRVYGNSDCTKMAFSSLTAFSHVVPCRYTQGTGIEILPFPGSTFNVEVGGISANGDWIVGYADTGGQPNLYIVGDPLPSPWNIIFGSVYANRYLKGTGVTDDGLLVCGYTRDAANSDFEPFVWTAGTFALLPGLAGGDGKGFATCMSADGLHITGFASDGSTVWAVRWSKRNSSTWSIIKLAEADGVTYSQISGGAFSGTAYAGWSQADTTTASLWVQIRE